MRNKQDFIRPAPDTRELIFHRADPAAAKTLEPSAVEHYNTTGFVGGLPVFAGEEADRIRTYVGELVDKVVAAPDDRDSYSINAYHLVCEGLYDIATNPLLLDYVTDILGPDFVCWGTTVFCKLPGDPKEVPLHQDAAYWPFTPSKSVTVWLSIDGADEENGAMWFVRGSHLLGALDHEDLGLDGTRVRKRRVCAADSYADIQRNVLAMGEASLHSDLALHGSPPNASGRRRTGLTIRYAAGDVRTLEGWEWWLGGAIQCRGHAGSWWANRRRPRGEHPEVMALFSDGQVAPDGG